MKFLNVSLLFLTWWPTFRTNSTSNCVQSFTYREYFKILDTRGLFFFLTIWFCLWSNIPLFLFELSYIFHTFENLKFPTFSWLFYPFPNPSWLCQQISYLFKALKNVKNVNLIPDFFKIFPTRGNPAFILLCPLPFQSTEIKMLLSSSLSVKGLARCNSEGGRKG